jgi:hypothetical protein
MERKFLSVKLLGFKQFVSCACSVLWGLVFVGARGYWFSFGASLVCELALVRKRGYYFYGQ